ncbi:MAG: hypothetical protein GW939_01405 [Candidatus Magasanikbacteria bacterium]|nr:hypothetical protein [Candidatus Magasanikbacteria bacterium]NCS72208.1 hypothetical protein [Candidatus Magasanikbacteria bacterium]
MKKKIISALGIDVILQWLTLFCSYRELPNAFEDINKPIATGGFPFKAFEYPVPPMGSDWPPSDMWPMFFANLAIWLVVGILIALIFGKKLENNKVFKTIGISAILLSVIGIFYIMLKFD